MKKLERDVKLNQKKSFISPPVFEKPCADGYQYALGHGLCYKLVKDKRTQDEARVFCADGGGELLQIRSEDELLIVADYLGRCTCYTHSPLLKHAHVIYRPIDSSASKV